MNLLYLALSALIVLSPYTHAMQKKKPPYGYPPIPNQNNAEVVYQWKVLEYNFPSIKARQQAEANGDLIPTNAIPIDVQPHYYSKFFLLL